MRFVAPAFAWMKIAAFLTLQGTLAMLIAAVVWALATGQRNDYRSGAPDDDEDA